MSTDLRHALRFFSRRPFFTAAVVLTLALAIGANAAIFSLARAVLLRPLPYDNPNRLVFALAQNPKYPQPHERHFPLTGTHVIEWQRQRTIFESVAVMETWFNNLAPRMDLATPDGAERLRGAFVTANFFELLGVRAALGRTFDSRDERGVPIAVISDAFWRRRFGGNPTVVGETLELISGRGKARTTGRYLVLGVLPPAFRFTYPKETEVWAIMPWSRLRPSYAAEFQLLGRLKDGVTRSHAETTLTSVLQTNIYLRQPALRDDVALVETLPEHVSAEVRSGVLLLVGAAGVVMLIACVNVALLLLAVIVDRRREIAIRTAVGASRGAIARQLLAEGTLLAGGGTAAGVGLAWLLVPVLRVLVPTMLPRGDEVSVDWAVLAFAAGAAVLTALVCGLAPIWHARTGEVQDGLRRSSTGATGDRSVALWRRVVVATQVSVVLVLLVAASLLLHSFWRMQRVNPGFTSSGLIALEMRVLNPKYFQPNRGVLHPGLAQFEREVLERVRALPGVQHVSMTSAIPFSGRTDFVYAIRPVGGSARKTANGRPVDPQYFSLMRIPLLAGRLFTDTDNEAAPRVVIVSESYGRSLFGDSNPVGRRLEIEPGTAEIVGVVGDVRHVDVRTAGAPALYFPRAQRPSELICLLVRPAAGASDTAAAVRAAIRSIDPEQPIENISTLDRLVGESTAEQRFYVTTTAGFAVLSVLLAIAGLAGVVSRTISERVREFAIRLAIGARPSDLMRLAIASGMLPVVVGLAIGLLGAWAASRLLRGFLFEITPGDPLTYAAGVVLLGASALAACYLPARRATNVDPMAALRAE